MNILKNINVLRRNLMRWITKSVGQSTINKNGDFIIKEDIKRVLITRPNHRLGNQLLITPLIQEVTETFPNCKIDLFVKGNVALILLQNHENIDKIIRLPKNHFKQLFQYIKAWMSIRSRRYDMSINSAKNSSSGRLSVKFSNSKYKFFGDSDDNLQRKYDDYNHIAKYPVYDFRNYISKLGIITTNNPIPSLDIKLSSFEIAEGKKKLHELVGKEARTICLFTFATGDKCYSESWWLAFYDKLKIEYTNYNFIEVLPVENISQIAFKAPSFYSKDIREICSVMANCDIFIGADSGIMHLSSASQTKTVGLFSITDIDRYQPYNNGSLGINTNEVDTDGIIKEIDKILLEK